MNKDDFSILLDKNFRNRFFNKAILKFGSQTQLANYLNKKFRDRKITRESIKGWLNAKHKYGWNIFIPICVIKELCYINSQDLDIVLSHTIKFNPPWIDPRKESLLVKTKRTFIFLKNNKFYLDLDTVLPEKSLEAQRSRKKLPLFTKINKKIITLWSEASWRKSEIKLKRFIELNELFFKGCAIFISEGTNKINKGAYNGSINIGNSEPSIIKIFLRWLNSFLIHYKILYTVEYNGNEANEYKLKDFWSKQININRNLIKIRVRKNYGSNLINNFGTFKIKIDNTVLKSFIINLLKVCRKIVLKNKKWCIQYLKGLLASEGSVDNDSILKQVNIGSTNFNERRFIKNILRRLNLRFYEGVNQITITNWNSFYNLFIYKVFEIDQINNYSKEKRFINGLKNHSKTKKLMKLYPFRDRKFNAYDWQNYYKLKYYISSHKYLNSLVKENFLKFKFIKNAKYFYINDKRLGEIEKIWIL